MCIRDSPKGTTPEKSVKELRKQTQRALVSLLGEVQQHRPRLIIGEGQGGAVAAMTTFPLILEKACRDRAVPQQQMSAFRRAWAGVSGIWVIGPCVLPTSNNRKRAPFEYLSKAYPELEWTQPKQNLRAMTMSFKYLTPPLAEELAVRMGCSTERDKYPPERLFEIATKPLPVYFETDDTAFQGVCCVWYNWLVHQG